MEDFTSNSLHLGGSVYEIRIKDDRINAYRVIKGENASDVDAKAVVQLAIWNEKWQRKQASELARASKEEAQKVQFLGAAERKNSLLKTRQQCAC